MCSLMLLKEEKNPEHLPAFISSTRKNDMQVNTKLVVKTTKSEITIFLFCSTVDNTGK